MSNYLRKVKVKIYLFFFTRFGKGKDMLDLPNGYLAKQLDDGLENNLL